MQALIEELSWRNAWSHTLLYGNRSEAERLQADESSRGWAKLHEDLAGFLDENPADRDMRLVASARVLVDMSPEIQEVAAQLGLTADVVLQCFSPDRLVETLRAMPFVGRTVDVVEARLRNPDEVWTGNDLYDLMFVACANAYAGLAVADKRFNHFLGKSGDQVYRSRIFPNLRSLPLRHLGERSQKV